MNNLFLTILIILVSVDSMGSFKEKVLTDNKLIVPGIGSENILINNDIHKVINSFSNYPYKISKFKSKKDIFRNIFKVKTELKIGFDKIVYFNTRKTVIFSYEDNVSAIVGTTSDRITKDSVSLKNGIEYFILKYGNEDLVVINKGRHKIYVYQKTGIALVDDDSDDSINMYMVFSGTK